MVSSYVLIYVASSPSPLLIMKEYLILTPLFSNQTGASTLTACLTSHQASPHILTFFPSLSPDPQPAEPFSLPRPRLAPSGTSWGPAALRCFAAIFTFPVAEGPRGRPAAASPQLGERMCLHRGDHDTKRLSFLSLFSPSFLHLLSQVKDNEVQWVFLILTDKFKWH